MRARFSALLLFAPFMIAGCNTPPIPPGKPVDIPTALAQVADGLCAFRKSLAENPQYRGVSLDSITVELDLSVDGSKSPPVAVAPDIQFMPTVAYTHAITAIKGSRLTLTLKPTGTPGSGDCPPVRPPAGHEAPAAGGPPA